MSIAYHIFSRNSTGKPLDPVRLRRKLSHCALFCEISKETTAKRSKALGFPDVARVFTPHPIQDRTDDEMRAYADQALEAIVAAVTRRQP